MTKLSEGTKAFNWHLGIIGLEECPKCEKEMNVEQDGCSILTTSYECSCGFSMTTVHTLTTISIPRPQ